MSVWRVRDLAESDLDEVLRLWEATSADAAVPALSVAELVGTLRDGHPGVVAVIGERVVGAALAQRAADRAWIQRVAIAADWRNRGIATDLLGSLETRLQATGVRRFAALVADADSSGAQQLFAHSGYRALSAVSFFEKLAPSEPVSSALLEQVGGTYLPEGLWDRIAGMADVKEIIERRVILPVQEAKLAARLGLQPPKAILLFGPPGTGKTSFARGVASRLGWPMVEVHASDFPASITGGAELRELFAVIKALDSAVVFLDEVEDIAGHRSNPSNRILTNELLKVIPGFRQGRNRLLVCATNDLAGVDPAFHRPGRFDCLIPVGLPDRHARSAIWDQIVSPRSPDVDLGILVESSHGFTPADIAHCASVAAHRAFERALKGGDAVLKTDDYVGAIEDFTPSTPSEVIDEFRDQATSWQRW